MNLLSAFRLKYTYTLLINIHFAPLLLVQIIQKGNRLNDTFGDNHRNVLKNISYVCGRCPLKNIFRNIFCTAI